MSDFGEPTYPVARKDHRCEWCGETILTSEKHAKFAGKWHGDWQNWRMHLECHDAADDSGELEEGFAPYEHDRPEVAMLTARDAGKGE